MGRVNPLTHRLEYNIEFVALLDIFFIFFNKLL